MQSLLLTQRLLRSLPAHKAASRYFSASWSTFHPWKVRTARGWNVSVAQAILSVVTES